MIAYANIYESENLMAVRLTERAAEEVRNYLEGRGRGLGIRVIVESSKCSGMAYQLVFVDKPEEHDVIFESHGSRVFVDPKSMIWLDGTVIDFIQDGDDSGFAFQNPNVTNQCGCGDSFYV